MPPTGDRPLVLERLRRAVPLVAVAVASLAAILMPTWPLRAGVFVAIVVGVMIAARRGKDKDEERNYGDLS